MAIVKICDFHVQWMLTLRQRTIDDLSYSLTELNIIGIQFTSRPAPANCTTEVQETKDPYMYTFLHV